MKYVSSLCALVLLLASSGALSAHHSAAAFDGTAEITVTGTVTDWRWVNPHVILKFDVKSDTGAVKPWAAEGRPPVSMVNDGWARTSFKVGGAISVTMRPARSGEPVGQLLRVVVLATGRAYVTAIGDLREAPGPGR